MCDTAPEFEVSRMADEEHVRILKLGVEAWNKWRKEHSGIRPDLSNVNLRDMNLRGADLSGSNLSRADLSGATIRAVRLNRADLSGASIFWTTFTRTDLQNADFRNAMSSGTIFAGTDLSSAQGLESVEHKGPSYLSIDTLYKSGGNIPEAFLRGCGLSDWQIEEAKLHNPNLSNEEITLTLYKVHNLRAHQELQICPLFISYSHKDSAFVDTIELNLNAEGIRFWRDTHDATAGRLEKQIDHAIRLNPTVLLVLSAGSVKSDWVEHEVRLARKLELESGRDVLCPVALDDSWKSCRWPERLREQIMEYNILDFSGWQDDKLLQTMFSKLLNGLSIFYK
jgi:hypothetical protein